MKRWLLPLSPLAAVLIPAIAVFVLVTGVTSPASANQTGAAELSLGVIAAPNVNCNPVDKPDQCAVELGTQFTLTADMNALPLTGFSGFTLEVVHAGMILDDIRNVVPDFETFSREQSGSFQAGGVTSFTPPIPKSTHLGRLVEADLTCTASPGNFTISLPVPRTNVVDQFARSIPLTTVQQGPDKAADTLTINCVDEQLTPPGLRGDASCDDTVNAIDAALILQFNAGLLSSVPCAEGADVNGDGNITSVDAALVLQFSAGLLGSLPP